MLQRSPNFSFGRQWHAVDLPDPFADVLCYWKVACLCFLDGLKMLLNAP